jgi:RNA polymerase sigma factor (sigma-70 family)
MSPAENVTFWISRLKEGDADAAQPLWERYFQCLVGLARHHLRGQLPTADAEDVALSAFASFCRGGVQGRFPRLNDREDLWQLLVLLTARKAGRLLRHENRQKRGGGKVRAEADLAGDADAESPLAQVVDGEPTPAFAAEVAEECQRLLARLGDDELRAVALAKMEGYTNQEIADQLDRDVRTVERRLRLIRKKWSQEDTP